MIVIFIFLFFVGGGWLLGRGVASLLMPKSKESIYYPCSNRKETKTVINNYTTENHLHISKEDLKALRK